MKANASIHALFQGWTDADGLYFHPRIRNKSHALEIVGGLTQTSKMPCLSYGIPAGRCQVGRKLRKVPGSTCSVCYACKGLYPMPDVQNAMERRYQSMRKRMWAAAMAYLISREFSGYFRWHDSGDIQSPEHLEVIAAIASMTPRVKHWLPTREYGHVHQCLDKILSWPANLIIRLSAYMLGADGPVALANKLGVQTSSVKRKGFNCPASRQGGECRDCRKCWDASVKDVSYKLH